MKANTGNGRLAALILLLQVTGWLVSCSSPRLQHGLPSQEAVAKKVVQALAGQDLQSLKDLALTKDEFARFVWPELPASNPKTNVPFDFVWNDVYYRSTTRMNALFQQMKGKRLSVVRTSCRRKVEEYATHKAYPDMEIVVKDESGKEGSYPLFGTLIEMDGVYKIYSYAPFD